MVLRVLTALCAAGQVKSRILCGPQWAAVEEAAELHALISSDQVRWVKPEATPSASAYAVMQSLPEETPVLVTTADHALLSAQVVDYFCAEACAASLDVAAGLARNEIVEAAYPGVRRTVLRLSDGGFCGCNLFAFLTTRGRAAADFWREVEQQRKKPLRLVSSFGVFPVLRYLCGRLSLGQALEGISRRMGLKAGAVFLPFPEAALDVDKVNDWQLAQSIVDNPTS